jgi:soluble lytic murein transglycosylase-like protein
VTNCAGVTTRTKTALAAMLVVLLGGCGGSDVLPYAPRAMSPLRIAAIERHAARESGVPQGLLHAVLMNESGGDPNAISAAGAEGLMQLMPATAAACGIDPFDPDANVACGAQYLRSLLDRYHGNVALALAAYNAGPGAVDRYRGIPPYPETQAYVARVMTDFRNW